MARLQALPFLPSTADLLLWLDAADTRTLNLSGNTVTQWQDKSFRAGHSNSLTGTITWSETGLNGRPCLNFPDGSLLQGPLTYTGTQWHAFVVANNGTMSGNGRYLSLSRVGVSDSESNTCIVIRRNIADTTLATLRNGSSSSNTAIPARGTPFLAQASGLGTSQFIAVNGSTTETTLNHGSSASLNVSIWNIGRSPLLTDVGSFLTGSIGEILLFNRQLSLLERQTVETYLARKWGIVPALPAGHQNSVAAPTNVLRTATFASTFSVRSIPDTLLWLDASDTTTTTFNGSSQISVWNDKSGLNYNMNTASVEFPVVGTPINGLRTIFFSPNAGIKQSTTISNTRTFFWVGRHSNQGDFNFLFGHDTSLEWHGDLGRKFVDNNSAVEFRNATGNLFMNGTNQTNSVINLPAPAVGDTFMLSCTFNATTAPMNLQGLAYDRGYSGRGYNGDVGEVICFNRQLSVNERELVESYLTQKWGLTNTLPVSHSHNTFPAGRLLPFLPLPNRFLRAFAPFIIGSAILGIDYTVTTDGLTLFFNFLATGKTMTITTTSAQLIDYLAIGGGGAGGRANGAGGGAGGLQRASLYTLPAGTYNITIGAGAPGLTNNGRGVNGSNTSFGAIATALGGGGGAGGFSALGGFNGGCGGGSVSGGTPLGTGSQGGRGSSGFGSGGGGGIGGVNGIGGDAYLANGGDGITFNNGTLLQLGGGGGGQTGIEVPEGFASFGGGLGGGVGGNGLANTGGGGGGHGSSGGAGGSGIFIINLARPLSVTTGRFIVGNGTLGIDYTITTNAGRTFLNFLGTQKTMTITTTSIETIDYFAIGGGGAGGRANGAGGGAGGLQRAEGYSLPAGTYTIIIGIGAFGQTNNIAGRNGRDTTFGSIVTALGGGGGGAINNNGRNGGCGGGAGQNMTIGTGSQGFNGGTGLGGGGGGGLGANGSGINGGSGITYNNGIILQVGGGGGGQEAGSMNGGTASFGGGTGGGVGGNALPNTGGGGGGHGTSGGAGGSGIFILSYI